MQGKLDIVAKSPILLCYVHLSGLTLCRVGAPLYHFILSSDIHFSLVYKGTIEIVCPVTYFFIR